MSRCKAGKRRLTLVLSGAVVALCLAIFDQLGQAPNVYAIETSPLPTPADLEQPYRDTTLPPLEALGESLSRPLFRASRRAPEPEPVATEPIKVEPLDYDLVGISLFDGRRVALVRKRRGGSVLRVTEGGKLGQWRVTGIDSKRLEVRSDSLIRELRLKDAQRRVIRTKARRGQEAAPAAAVDSGEQDAAEAAVQ